MTRRLKVFRSIFFLIILVTLSHIQNIAANQNPTLPPLPPLENSTESSTTLNKTAAEKVNSSFIERIKNFFTFKKKELPRINITSETNISENENESFVDLGDNRLQEIKVEESDKTKLLQIPAEFENLVKSNEQVSEPFPASNLPHSTSTRDNKLEDLPPNLPQVDLNQQDIINKTNNNPTVTSVAPIVTNQSVANDTEVKEALRKRASNDLPIPNVESELQIPQLPDDNIKANLNNDKQVAQSNIQSIKPEAPELPNLPVGANNSSQNDIKTNAMPTLQPGTQKFEAATPVTTPKDLAQDSNARILNETKSLEEVKADIPTIPELLSKEALESTITTEPVVDKQIVEKIEIPTHDNSKDIVTKNTLPPSVDPVEKVEIPSVPEVPSVPILSDADNATEAISENKGKVIITRDVDDKNNEENLSKFVIDEAKVLLLPNDDIVLGELTDMAEFEQIDFLKYSKMFERQLDQANRFKQRSVIQNFLRDYDTNFNKVSILSDVESARDAFDAINKNSLFRLRVLMDNNNLLQSKNEEGDTLLHVAAERNNYYLTKFLILRGVNLSALNSNNETALMIGLEIENPSIIKLLKDAVAHLSPHS